MTKYQFNTKFRQKNQQKKLIQQLEAASSLISDIECRKFDLFATFFDASEAYEQVNATC